MPSERETAALREILRNIDLAEQFTRGHSVESLQRDEKTLYAVVRSLEIISEASRQISDAVKARHSQIEWREMAAAGNVYRRNYEDVTARRVWNTLQVHLPRLRTAIEQELAKPCCG
jgi:uncharacterized protein with HEPN domain